MPTSFQTGRKANDASSPVLKPERIRQNLKTLEKNASKLSGSFGVKFSPNSSATQVKQRIAEKIETMASRFND